MWHAAEFTTVDGLEPLPEHPERGDVHDARPAAGRRPCDRDDAARAVRLDHQRPPGRVRGRPGGQDRRRRERGDPPLGVREGRRRARASASSRSSTAAAGSARCETVFFDTLLDENAASHIALGSAYALAVDGRGRQAAHQREPDPHRLHDRQPRARRRRHHRRRRARAGAPKRRLADLAPPYDGKSRSVMPRSLPRCRSRRPPCEAGRRAWRRVRHDRAQRRARARGARRDRGAARCSGRRVGTRLARLAHLLRHASALRHVHRPARPCEPGGRHDRAQRRRASRRSTRRAAQPDAIAPIAGGPGGASTELATLGAGDVLLRGAAPRHRPRRPARHGQVEAALLPRRRHAHGAARAPTAIRAYWTVVPRRGRRRPAPLDDGGGDGRPRRRARPRSATRSSTSTAAPTAPPRCSTTCSATATTRARRSSTAARCSTSRSSSATPRTSQAMLDRALRTLRRARRRATGRSRRRPATSGRVLARLDRQPLRRSRAATITRDDFATGGPVPLAQARDGRADPAAACGSRRGTRRRSRRRSSAAAERPTGKLRARR